MSDNGRRIAVVRSYDELHAVLRARANELQVTREGLDAVSGLQNGYCAKLLAPVPIKAIGPVSMGPLLGALGLMLIVVEDAEMLARIASQMQLRERPIPADADHKMPTTKRRKRWRFPKGPEFAKLMRARSLVKMSDAERRRLARRAARLRWRRRRKVKAAAEPSVAAALPPAQESKSSRPTSGRPSAGKSR